MSNLLITDERVIKFYNSNPDIDINTMNLLLVEMLERVLDKSNPINLAQELISKIDGLKIDMKQQMQDSNVESRKDMREMIRSEVGVNAISGIIEDKLDKSAGYQSEKIKNDINSTIHSVVGDKLIKIDVKSDDLSSKFQEYIGRQENSNQKGRMSENELKLTLDDIFPMAVVEKISGEAHTCDIIIKREGKDDILVENKNYKTKVPITEVNKFISDIQNKEKHGIFISQYSSIANKDNFQIDIDGDKVLLYICNVNYDKDMISTGVKIVDNFSNALKKVSSSSDSENVKMKILEGFNDDYKKFITKRDNLTTKLKENYNQLQEIIRDLNMPNIDKFLIERFAHAESNVFVCDICNVYKSINLKGLNKHKTHCKKKKDKVVTCIETE